MSRQRRDERGGATVMVVACLGLLLFVGAALGVVTAMVAAHRRVQSAADLAALGAARTLADGGAACDSAAELAAANGARVTGCSVAGTSVTVTVSVTGPRWMGQQDDLGATSRAGPAP